MYILYHLLYFVALELKSFLFLMESEKKGVQPKSLEATSQHNCDFWTCKQELPGGMRVWEVLVHECI